MGFLDFEFHPLIQSIVSGALKIILALIAYAIFSPIGKRLISSMMSKSSEKQRLSESRATTLEKLLKNIYGYVLIFILIITVLKIFGIPVAPLLAGAGVVGLAIGFGAQGLVSDVVTGFFILLEKQIDVDDYVSLGGESGIVEEVGLRTTQMRGFDGTLHFIPNRNISNVNNHSRGNMRALVDIGISYDENIDEVVKVLQDVCDQFAAKDERVKEGPDVVGVQSFGSSDVVLRIIAQTENMEQWAVERELRKEIKQALNEANIEIPYPHQVNISKS
ncbi:small conductance mechanosensitive channel [Salinibacillus kushneri]|uniref:Small conductance mechanosensitive channel n=1 Tax=Salinibacillus kushneri TaxID=237682 RepID=A0A1I0I9B6_9BACI|nr:mechanosensitive ion channel family protein [Salinibacillus kushneri]SET92579.1 small conductance mechanosensitive channel [Salinibacillus kushneri]